MTVIKKRKRKTSKYTKGKIRKNTITYGRKSQKE